MRFLSHGLNFPFDTLILKCKHNLFTNELNARSYTDWATADQRVNKSKIVLYYFTSAMELSIFVRYLTNMITRSANRKSYEIDVGTNNRAN